MLRTLAISTLIFASAASVAYAADVFRWVDEHGGVHYSDQWVPGSEVVKSTKPHPATSTAHTAQHTDQPKLAAGSDRASSQLAQQGTTQAVKQDVAKAREQQCKEAKDRYEKAVQARRIYKAGKEGDKAADTDRPADREYMSEAEADAYRIQARTDMQQACGPAAK